VNQLKLDGSIGFDWNSIFTTQDLEKLHDPLDSDSSSDENRPLMPPRGTNADRKPADTSSMIQDVDLVVDDNTEDDVSSVADPAPDPDTSDLTEDHSSDTNALKQRLEGIFDEEFEAQTSQPICTNDEAYVCDSRSDHDASDDSSSVVFPEPNAEHSDFDDDAFDAFANSALSASDHPDSDTDSVSGASSMELVSVSDHEEYLSSDEQSLQVGPSDSVSDRDCEPVASSGESSSASPLREQLSADDETLQVPHHTPSDSPDRDSNTAADALPEKSDSASDSDQQMSDDDPSSLPVPTDILNPNGQLDISKCDQVVLPDTEWTLACVIALDLSINVPFSKYLPGGMIDYLLRTWVADQNQLNDPDEPMQLWSMGAQLASSFLFQPGASDFTVGKAEASITLPTCQRMVHASLTTPRVFVQASIQYADDVLADQVPSELADGDWALMIPVPNVLYCRFDILRVVRLTNHADPYLGLRPPQQLRYESCVPNHHSSYFEWHMICLTDDGDLNVNGENDMAPGTAFHLRSFFGHFLSVSDTGALCVLDQLRMHSCTFVVTTCGDSVSFRPMQSDNVLGTLERPSALQYTKSRAAHGDGAIDHDVWHREANHWGALLLTHGEDDDGNVTLVARFADSNTKVPRTERNALWITNQIGQAMHLRDRTTFQSVQVPQQTSDLCGLFTVLNLMTMAQRVKSGQSVEGVGVDQQEVEDFRVASFNKVTELLEDVSGARWPTFLDSLGNKFRIPDSSKRVAHQGTSTQTNQGVYVFPIS
jgi:hypothetical protein